MRGLAPLLVLLLVGAAAVAAWPLTVPFGNGGSDLETIRYLATWVEIGVLALAWAALHRSSTAEQKITVLVLVLASLPTLSPWFGDAGKSYDYTCYELGAKSILAHQNPYVSSAAGTPGQIFGYAPPLAQALAGLHQAVVWWVADEEASWRAVFMTFQVGQMLAVLACLGLTWHWLKTLGIASPQAAFCAAAVFAASYPARETAYASQVNFMLLLALLGFLCLVQARPYLAGFVAGCGSCLKPYLAALPLGVLQGAGLRPLLGLALVAEALAVHMYFDPNARLVWLNYYDFMQHYPVEHFWSNISVTNLTAMVGGVWQASVGDVAILGHTLALGLSAGLLFRIVKRAQALRQPNLVLFYAQVFDVLAIAFINSPKVWYHHFVLAMPLLAFVVALCHERSPWRCVLAVGLTEALGPTMPFPLSLLPWIGLGVALSLLPLSRSSHRPGGGAETFKKLGDEGSAPQSEPREYVLDLSRSSHHRGGGAETFKKLGDEGSAPQSEPREYVIDSTMPREASLEPQEGQLDQPIG